MSYFNKAVCVDNSPADAQCGAAVHMRVCDHRSTDHDTQHLPGHSPTSRQHMSSRTVHMPPCITIVASWRYHRQTPRTQQHDTGAPNSPPPLPLHRWGPKAYYAHSTHTTHNIQEDASVDKRQWQAKSQLPSFVLEAKPTEIRLGRQPSCAADRAADRRG